MNLNITVNPKECVQFIKGSSLNIPVIKMLLFFIGYSMQLGWEIEYNILIVISSWFR